MDNDYYVSRKRKLLKGGETRVAVPEPMEAYIRSRRSGGGRDSIVP
jgi:hypothetical protein